MKKSFLAASALSLSFMAADASAAVVWSFEETGGGVVGSFSGSLDLTGATSPSGSTVIADSAIAPSIALLANVPSPSGATLDDYVVTGPASFGPGTGEAATVGMGDALAVIGNQGLIGVPAGYSGGSLSGSIRFAGESFASLGVTPGTYVYALPNDTVTLLFGEPAVIPLPATLPLLLGALGLVAFGGRRRA